jgi:hypothetical protein
MKQLLIIASLLTIGEIVAQSKNHEKISFYLEYTRHQYAMDSLNETYMNFNINETGWLKNKISSGQYFGLSLIYRPNAFFDVVLKLAYQYGISSHTSSSEIYGISPIPIEAVRYFEVNTSSFNINPTISIYDSQILDYFYPKEIEYSIMVLK